MLRALISDVATVIYQCCDGPSDEKILIGCPGASSAVFRLVTCTYENDELTFHNMMLSGIFFNIICKHILSRSMILVLETRR